MTIPATCKNCVASKLMPRWQTNKFSYNHDGFVESAESSGARRKPIPVYPKAGIIDIVVNVCSTQSTEDALYGEPGLLIKVDYAPDVIYKEKLRNAFA